MQPNGSSNNLLYQAGLLPFREPTSEVESILQGRKENHSVRAELVRVDWGRKQQTRFHQHANYEISL